MSAVTERRSGAASDVFFGGGVLSFFSGATRVHFPRPERVGGVQI